MNNCIFIIVSRKTFLKVKFEDFKVANVGRIASQSLNKSQAHWHINYSKQFLPGEADGSQLFN